MRIESKQEALEGLYEQLEELTTSPLYGYRQEHGFLPVIGDGNVEAQIVFVGEAPGKSEALSGKPFMGAAGKMLNTLLASIDLKREDVYITNLVHDRPPDNRDPNPAEIALYSPFLLQTIRIIQPIVIATLGRHSLKFLLQTYGAKEVNETITTLHGKPISVLSEWGKVTIVPLYHPAYALYNGSKREILIKDMQVMDQYIK